MKVLVTGGTGLVGAATVDRLLAAGHSVRLLSRHAEADARRWPNRVEPWPGDVTSDRGLAGACDGCDAVVHSVGIVSESPPEATFQSVNVDGTRRMAVEARRAGVKRFVYVSSLGADVGTSPYHQSKLAGEQAVREVDPPGWIIVRPGNVYGPGDEVISLLLRMVRTLPVIPTIGLGNQPFQPVWHVDVGEALCRAATSEQPAGIALDLAGPDVTTPRELMSLMSELTNASAPSVPIPEFLARLGTRAAELLGVATPINESQITMLVEENVLAPGRINALTQVFGVQPTSLRSGILQLLDALPAQLPSDGLGDMRRERFWADIHGAALDADALFRHIQDHFAELPPPGLLQVGSEPGGPVTLRTGHTISLAVPMRGHVQVRVTEVDHNTATLVTVAGHFLAGVIRFMVRTAASASHPDDSPGEGRLRFEVRSYTRAASLPDLVAMRTLGAAAQVINWSAVVEEVVRRSGGAASDGVRHESNVLDEREASRVEEWVEEAVMRLKRSEAPS
jgi:uncharacterized protein YbjT (DUF2867 family)